MAKDVLTVVRTLRRRNGSLAVLARTFPDAPHDALVDAAARAEVRRFKPGAAVVTEGEPGDRFYVVMAGAAEVTQLATTGQMHLCSYERGDFFGEVGLLRCSPRTATVRAVSPVRTLTLDRATFDGLLRRSGSTPRAWAS